MFVTQLSHPAVVVYNGTFVRLCISQGEIARLDSELAAARAVPMEPVLLPGQVPIPHPTPPSTRLHVPSPSLPPSLASTCVCSSDGALSGTSTCFLPSDGAAAAAAAVVAGGGRRFSHGGATLGTGARGSDTWPGRQHLSGADAPTVVDPLPAPGAVQARIEELTNAVDDARAELQARSQHGPDGMASVSAAA